MKYDLSKKQTQGARRTLRAFSNALVALLEQKPFESIQVNELCQACMIPKSTFYNYFDDKYDPAELSLSALGGADLSRGIPNRGPVPARPGKSCAGCWTLWSSIRTC